MQSDADTRHRAALIDTALDLAASHFGRDEPMRVLDAGCGKGALFGRALTARLPWDLVGLEADGAAVTEASNQGVPVVRGSATALPFPDASFDLVVLRHVLHHLAEPGRAVAEAARVARRGVLLAEPLFDDTRPDQAASLVLEIWSRRIEWRAGLRHDLPHSEESIRAMIPETWRIAGTARTVSREPRDPLAFATEFLPLLGADDDRGARALRDDLDQILAAGETMTRPGTLALLLIR